MVADMALTPPRGARGKVGLPCVECRRPDALQLDTLDLCFGTLLLEFGDPVALLLARVHALVGHRLQSACLVAGGVKFPRAHVTYGYANGLPVDLGFKNERLCASGHANSKAGRIGVPEECLCRPFG